MSIYRLQSLPAAVVLRRPFLCVWELRGSSRLREGFDGSANHASRARTHRADYSASGGNHAFAAATAAMRLCAATAGEAPKQQRFGHSHHPPPS